MASKSKHDAANQVLDVGELLDDIAVKFERIKQLYEQFFMGIEKQEPHVLRKELMRNLLLLQQQNIRNTGLRFRFNMLQQKWSSYSAYWMRTMRAMENGTYTRHLKKAKRLEAATAAPPETAKPAAAAAATPRPAAAAGPSLQTAFAMNDGELHALYDRYTAARKATGDLTPVKFETLVNSLNKQVPQVLQQTGAKSVAFDVATVNGKVILKAVPKK